MSMSVERCAKLPSYFCRSPRPTPTSTTLCDSICSSACSLAAPLHWHSVVIAEHAKFCAILCRFNSFLLADFLVSYLSHISLLAWHFISLRFEIYAYAYSIYILHPLLEYWITNSRSCNCSVKIVQSVGSDFNWFGKARLAWPTNFAPLQRKTLLLSRTRPKNFRHSTYRPFQSTDMLIDRQTDEQSGSAGPKLSLAKTSIDWPLFFYFLFFVAFLLNCCQKLRQYLYLVLNRTGRRRQIIKVSGHVH